MPTAIAGKLSGQGATVHLDPTATLLRAFQASILLRRPPLDEDLPTGQSVSCAHNRGDLTCVIFSRGIPAVFSLGLHPCPDRIEGPTA